MTHTCPGCPTSPAGASMNCPHHTLKMTLSAPLKLSKPAPGLSPSRVFIPGLFYSSFPNWGTPLVPMVTDTAPAVMGGGRESCLPAPRMHRTPSASEAGRMQHRCAASWAIARGFREGLHLGVSPRSRDRDSSVRQQERGLCRHSSRLNHVCGNLISLSSQHL